MNRAEWMKGICHTWSRGRLISPSLPVGDDWYLNLSSQKRPTGRNLGGNRSVRRSGTASRGTVVLVFLLRMRSSLELKFLPYSWETISALGQVVFFFYQWQYFHWSGVWFLGKFSELVLYRLGRDIVLSLSLLQSRYPSIALRLEDRAITKKNYRWFEGRNWK